MKNLKALIVLILMASAAYAQPIISAATNPIFKKNLIIQDSLTVGDLANDPTMNRMVVWDSLTNKFSYRQVTTLPTGSGSTDLSYTGATSPVTLNSSTGTDVTITEGGIVTLSATGTDLTISATEVDGSVTNELQDITVTGASQPFTIDLSDDATDVTITGAGISTVTRSGNDLTITSTEVDGSTSNEIQDISVTGTTTATLDLSGDASDASITGAGINVVSVVGDAITITGTEVDGSTSNEIQDMSITGASSPFTLDLTGTAADINFAQGGIVTLSESPANTLVITATEVDGSTSNELQTFSNTSDATSHTVTLSNSGGSVQLVEGSNITLTTTGTASDGIVTIASTGGGSPTLTSTYVGYGDGSNLLTGEAAFTYDAVTNNRLTADQFNIPTTTSGGAGAIYQNGSIFMHTYSTTTKNLFIGSGGGNLTNSGATENIAITPAGNALDGLTSGDRNISVGANAGGSISTGSRNISIGTSALQDYNPSDNVSIGESAAQKVGGSSNVYVGNYAGGGATVKSGADFNTALGRNALYDQTADYNVGIGYQAGNDLTNGVGNVVIGANVLGVAGMANKLWIDNGGASTITSRPFIEGDFSADTLRFNSTVSIRDVAISTSDTLLVWNPLTKRVGFKVETGGGNVTKVGTPVNNQIGVWTGDGTIEGDANFTWDGNVLDVNGYANITHTVATQTTSINAHASQSQPVFEVTDGGGNTYAQVGLTGKFVIARYANDAVSALKVGNLGASATGNNLEITNGASGVVTSFDINGKINEYNNTTITNGQLLIGHTANGTFEKATLTAGTGTTITNGAGSITIAPSTAALCKSITIESPTATEDISMWFADDAITITKMVAVLVGSSTPSVTWTVRHSTDRSATGNEVVTSGTTTTSTTTGSVVTSFNDATVPADSFVWVETTAKSGTVGQINLTIYYTLD